MEALDTKISQLQTIAAKLGDGSINMKISTLQREKEILAFRENISKQQALALLASSANQDKKEELISFLGEEFRNVISKSCICGDDSCKDCLCCQVDHFKTKGLTADEIKLIVF